MKRLLVAVPLMLIALVACAPTDIKADDYDQSCASSEDCVEVSELETRGTDCSFSCESKAINKKDKAQYDEDLADSEKHCGSKASPFCDSTGAPTCVEGKCVMK
jgi:hypothetical protein